MQKVHSQRIHAKLRAAERYGVDLNKVRRREVIEAIQAKRAQFVERQSLRVTIWMVEVDGVQMRVVYDAKRHSIASCLPLEPKEEAAA